MSDPINFIDPEGKAAVAPLLFVCAAPLIYSAIDAIYDAVQAANLPPEIKTYNRAKDTIDSEFGGPDGGMCRPPPPPKCSPPSFPNPFPSPFAKWKKYA